MQILMLFSSQWQVAKCPKISLTFIWYGWWKVEYYYLYKMISQMKITENGLYL